MGGGRVREGEREGREGRDRGGREGRRKRGERERGEGGWRGGRGGGERGERRGEDRGEGREGGEREMRREGVGERVGGRERDGGQCDSVDKDLDTEEGNEKLAWTKWGFGALQGEVTPQTDGSASRFRQQHLLPKSTCRMSQEGLKITTSQILNGAP